jgi:hypothetical protein
MHQTAFELEPARPLCGTALLIEHHRAHRVRLLGRAPGRALRVRVAFVDRPSEPQRELPPRELQPDAPLTPREEAEYQRLDRRLAGQDRPPRPIMTASKCCGCVASCIRRRS